MSRSFLISALTIAALAGAEAMAAPILSGNRTSEGRGERLRRQAYCNWCSYWFEQRVRKERKRLDGAGK